MREIIKERLAAVDGTANKYNLLREYVQALALKFIEQDGYSKNLAFVGGTALRFLYDIGRFSEDLDFSLVTSAGFDFEAFNERLVSYFSNIGMVVESKPKIIRAVYGSFLKFPELMFENGLSHRKDQKLFIKLEADSKPPQGFVTEVSFVQNKLLSMNVVHYNLPSLFAGKLHAVLFRQYTKGRDFYDLMWFLGRKVVPNFVQLENAISQTTGKRPELDADVLKNMLKKRLQEVDWEKVTDEVEPFLVVKDEMRYLTFETLDKLVANSWVDTKKPV